MGSSPPNKGHLHNNVSRVQKEEEREGGRIHRCRERVKIGDMFFLQTCPGMEQYAIKKFAESLEALPRALAENSGVKV